MWDQTEYDKPKDATCEEGVCHDELHWQWVTIAGIVVAFILMACWWWGGR